MKTTRLLTLAIVSLSVLLSSAQSHAAAVITGSSGLKKQFYNLEWCSPHHTRLDANWSGSCRTGSFQNIGGVAKIVYDGKDYPTGNVAPNLSGLVATRTQSTINDVTQLVSFFNANTSGAFHMEGEGVITLRVFMTDHADNTSFYKITYKIDKTAPQLSFEENSITEASSFTHYEWTVGTGTTVTKNDSSSISSSSNATNPLAYQNPLPALYLGDSALPRANHIRANLPAYYFKNWDTTPFTLKNTYSDTYGTYLTNTATPVIAGGYTGPLTSGEQNFELVTEAGSPIKTQAWLVADFTNADFSDIVWDNIQKKYRLRLYDKTVDASGNARSGNYSETAFYVVKDNTVPNMGGNGLAATKTEAIEQFLKFDAPTTAWDKTIPGYNPESNASVSKFVAANNSQVLYSSISDVGITGNGITTGTNANTDTVNSLYNVGLDRVNFKVEIEQPGSISAYNTAFTYPNRFINKDLSTTSDFSNVDLARSNGYRKYKTKITNGGLSGMCDLVGNCIEPKLTFRVVAADASDTTSIFSLETGTQATPWKVFANGTDSYKLSYTIKDRFGNRVVPVRAMENSGTPQIKTVDSSVRFQNGLHADQRSNTPSGVKLAGAADLQSDNETVTNSINTGDFVTMRENVSASPTVNDALYALGLTSKVPTKAFYPYISDNSVLRISAITNVAGGSAASDITYPASGNRIGYFEKTSSGGTTNDFIIADKGGLSETANFADFVFDDTQYGKITASNAVNASFTSFANRRANLEFASPTIYGMVGMTMGALTPNTIVSHTKKLYNFSSFTPRIYEKNLVAYTNTNGKDAQPGILDFNSRVNPAAMSPINSGVCYGGASCENIFLVGGTPVLKNYNANNTSMQMRMSHLDNMSPYTLSNLHLGFVSAITYSDGTNTIKLPSVARDINNVGNTFLDQYSMARYYFSDTYSLGDSTDRVQNLARALTDIAITGLTNKYTGVTTSTGGIKGNENIGAELTRFHLVTSIKKNVSILSAGLKPSTETSGQRWCAGGTINQTFIDGGNAPASDCTQTINGEMISFIDGNATLDCGVNPCRTNKKRSIIVKNGSLQIKSNITTLNASGVQTNGQLFLWVMNEAGLSNITVDETNPDITAANKKGWLFIDPAITNIDAFLFAQGPMVSYKAGWEFYPESSTDSDTELRNQLHIMGSLLTLNKIGEAETPVCPYIVSNCTLDTAPIFDLVNFRNFKFQSLSLITENATDNTIMTPFFPALRDANGAVIQNGHMIAKVSGGNVEDREPTGAITCNGELRCITDHDYRPYPMLIERDTRWNSSPSELFKVNN